MTKADVARLLTLCAVYDQRTIGEEDVEGWYLIATAERWNAAAAKRVVVEHYSRDATRERLRPALISDALRDARNKAAGSFLTPDPPEGLPARDYPSWLRARQAEHVTAVLERWAKGAPIPDPIPLDNGAGQLRIDQPPEGARTQITRAMANIGRSPEAAER